MRARRKPAWRRSRSNSSACLHPPRRSSVAHARSPTTAFPSGARGTASRRTHRKIRVGYVSGEFRQQATAYLTAGLFECHDRERFDISAIATGPNDFSPMRTRLEQAFDRFHDVSAETDREIADLIRAEDIDILVNLNGYFGLERTAVFAQRPSPIQVNYLGFPGTMGVPFMDYIVADRIVLPEDQQQHFAEKVAYLPYTYQPNDGSAPSPERRLHAQGLRPAGERHRVLLLQQHAQADARALRHLDAPAPQDAGERAVGASRRTRRSRKTSGAKRVSAAWTPERIVFGPVLKLADHMSRLQLADLFLDTLPHNAHTTASDALWCGVPVITCLGTTFAGRVAASLLNAVSLGELVTQSLEEYEALALQLANNPQQLQALKARLAANRDTAALFDTPGYTRLLESAYLAMWERHLSGEPPATFAVEAQP